MASQGPKSPSNSADDATVGTVAWTNPTNVLVSDATYAKALLECGVGTSHYLKATNFKFSIPVGIIVGVVVEIQKKEQDDGNICGG